MLEKIMALVEATKPVATAVAVGGLLALFIVLSGGRPSDFVEVLGGSRIFRDYNLLLILYAIIAGAYGMVLALSAIRRHK